MSDETQQQGSELADEQKMLDDFRSENAQQQQTIVERDAEIAELRRQLEGKPDNPEPDVEPDKSGAWSLVGPDGAPQLVRATRESDEGVEGKQGYVKVADSGAMFLEEVATPSPPE